MAAEAATAIAINAGIKVGGDAVDSVTGGLSEFLSHKFRGGKSVPIDLPRAVLPGQKLMARDCPVLRELGIEYICCIQDHLQIQVLHL